MLRHRIQGSAYSRTRKTPSSWPSAFFNTLLVRISIGFRAEQLPCAVESQNLFVVASGSEWPEGGAFDPRALGIQVPPRHAKRNRIPGWRRHKIPPCGVLRDPSLDRRIGPRNTL